MSARHEEVTKLSTNGGWFEGTITRDPVLAPLLPRLRRLAASDTPVLITGEPGTGRELAARAIHNLSGRGAQPFVVLDCVSLSESLIEAELLGVDGNGGGPYKIGIFEQAGTGTVLLREVGELPPRIQDELATLIERHEIARLNSRTAIPTRARCLASSSIDLRTRIQSGLFRENLHARIASEVLALPGLRERTEDIPQLARHFLLQCCGQLPGGAPEISHEVEGLLVAYPWPGNLRELRETVERAAIHARGGRILPEHLPDHLRTGAGGGALPSLRDVEMRHIERVLHEAGGNQRRASRILGISRWSLSRRLRKYGMAVHGEE
jgi:DNA-binding NtrC family response regulator